MVYMEEKKELEWVFGFQTYPVSQLDRVCERS